MQTRDVIIQRLETVPQTVSRKHIEDVITRFAATYEVADIDSRIKFFADTATLDDPAGLRVANTAREIKEFFSGTADQFALKATPDQLVVVGNEAILEEHLFLQFGDTDPEVLRLYVHFVFAADGLITSLRTFFDESCLSERVASVATAGEVSAAG